MRILVSQTTRMGDVLQTSPLVRAIRHKHPDAHIAMLVRRMGRTIAERNPDINEVIVYEEDSMFLDMRARDSDRLLRAYEAAEGYIQTLRDGHYDVAYNCTHSISSAMMLKLADIPEVVGAHLSDDWQFVLRGAWTVYFFTSVFHREYNDLNLCDITRRYVPEAPVSHELVFEVRDEDRRIVDGLLNELGIGPDDFLVCFQLGASEDNKRWSEMHFATLGRMLKDRLNARVVLLGITEEAAFGEIFEQSAPGIAAHLFGRTSIPQVAAILERAKLLVTNDTGTMHLATAVGCPIVLVSVGYVHFRETGPYGPGHCAIECRREHVGRADGVPEGLDERTRILPEQVYRVVEIVLASKPDQIMPQMETEALMDGVDVYRTQFAPDGCLQWYPALRRTPAQRDFCRIAYRTLWLDDLGVQRDAGIERTSLALLLNHYEPPDAETLKAWRAEFVTMCRLLTDVTRRGIEETSRLIAYLGAGKDGLALAQQSVQVLNEVDEEMRLFGELHAAAKPIVRIAQFERDNLEGADAMGLAQTALEIYQSCHDRASLFMKKIDLVADLWQT